MSSIPQGEFFEVAGVRTYVVRRGQGSPIIMLHGLGATSYSWRRLIPELSQKYEVYAIDIPGFGRSDKPDDFTYTFEGFSKWLVSFIDHFKISSAALIGNSMGGCIALRTAMENPLRVHRLALLGTPAYVHNHPDLIWPLRWPLVGKLFELALGPWAVALVAPTAFYDKKHVTPELLAEYGYSLNSPEGRRAVVRFVRGAVPPDAEAWIARYPELGQPTLVVNGDHDGVVDRASAVKFCKAIQKGTLLTIPECGHAAQEERPEVVIPALVEFLGVRL